MLKALATALAIKSEDNCGANNKDILQNTGTHTTCTDSDAISFCNVGGGAVDNNSYEWLLKLKNESQ